MIPERRNEMNTCSPVRRRMWRELTDEERWNRIYDERRRVRDSLPRALPEARRLVLPVAPLLDAIQKSRGILEFREDAVKGVATHVAKASSRLSESHRNVLIRDSENLSTRCRWFVEIAPQYVYAASSAIVRCADERFFPADSPAGLAALAIKMDVEENEEVPRSFIESVSRIFDEIIGFGG